MLPRHSGCLVLATLVIRQDVIAGQAFHPPCNEGILGSDLRFRRNSIGSVGHLSECDLRPTFPVSGHKQGRCTPGDIVLVASWKNAFCPSSSIKSSDINISMVSVNSNSQMGYQRSSEK